MAWLAPVYARWFRVRDALDLPRVLEYQKRATDAAWLSSFVAEAA